MDYYSYWRNALNGTFGAVHEGDPQCGFFAKRGKNGADIAVAIWLDGGNIVCLINNKLGGLVEAQDVWTWCCKKPITQEEYNDILSGKRQEGQTAGIGHNSQETGEPYADLLAQWQDDAEQAKAILAKPIETQEQADNAASWTKRLGLISKKATDLHKVEKQPHLDAGRAVDEKWRELKDDPKDLATKLKRAMDGYLQRLERERQEAERKARAEAEAKRREAEELAKQDEAAAAELMQQAAETEKAAQAQNAKAGRTGASVALRTFISAEITNYDALLMALKERQEVQELVQSLANRAAKSGVELAGMKIKEEKRAA